MKEKFSAAETSVQRAIGKYRETLASMSIVQFSEVANVSTATIVRTLKKMGYTGYSDFRHALLSEAKENKKYAVLRESDAKIQQVITQNQQEVNQTIAQLNISAIEDGVQAIRRAPIIYVFARGLSELVGEEMTLKFQLAGKMVQYYHDPNIIKKMAARAPLDSVALIISLNGTTEELVEAARTLQKRGILTLTITTQKTSPLVAFSDIAYIGYQAGTSYFSDYEVRSRLPIQVIARILIDAYVVRVENEDSPDA